jgi:hypothetical protein
MKYRSINFHLLFLAALSAVALRFNANIHSISFISGSRPFPKVNDRLFSSDAICLKGINARWQFPAGDREKAVGSG